MALSSAGSDLYFIDPDTDTVTRVECITTADNITAPVENIDTTCLSDKARKSEPGLSAPGVATFGINFDPQAPSHVRLHQLYKTRRKNIKWALALSDGTEDLTADADGDFDTAAPVERSFLSFIGYLSDYPFSLAIGAAVVSTMSIQISGDPDLVVKTEPEDPDPTP